MCMQVIYLLIIRITRTIVRKLNESTEHKFSGTQETLSSSSPACPPYSTHSGSEGGLTLWGFVILPGNRIDSAL